MSFIDISFIFFIDEIVIHIIQIDDLIKFSYPEHNKKYYILLGKRIIILTITTHNEKFKKDFSGL